MELNREQIVKALECFHQRILKTGLAEKVTEADMMAIVDALALIRELSEKLNTAREDAVRDMYEKIYDVSYEGRHGTLVEVVSIEDIVREMLKEGNKNDR